ncbi:MAG: GNAT family N-acetyltransferase [Alphaproteobacteria bacterium]|nr:GNAT family N-acetyltransferase [Alphaproteobacteria bacterium]
MLAAIHAASWRSAYRGLLPDEFLDREVDGERAAHWRSRMHAADATELGIFLAEAEGRALGFALVDLDASPARGALLDNLHVAPGFTGRGIGRVLLGRAARWASDRRADIALHLELLDGNDAAARFYLRHGARPGARILKRRPEGPVAFILYSWPDAAALAAALRQ